MTALLIAAGEPSGDQLGAELVEAASRMRPDASFFGATGPALEAAGAERVVATSELSVMGLTEVVRKLPMAWRAIGLLDREAGDREAAGAILIDAPDFNLRLARRLRRRGIPVVQYVSPTVWAWRSGRTADIARDVRRLLVTLPFEPRAYEGTGVDAVYVGNPAVDRVPTAPPARDAVADELGADADAPWLALLPGSRRSELERLGPLFVAAAARVRDDHPEVELIAPVAPGLDAAEVAAALADGPPVRLVSAPRRYGALAHAVAAIAASGTASLELALLGVPHVVAYRLSPVTWRIARLLVRTEHVALPNLILGRRVVPELLQGAARPETLAAPVLTWLRDPEARSDVRAGLEAVRRLLGAPGVARRAARSALEAIGLHPTLA